MNADPRGHAETEGAPPAHSGDLWNWSRSVLRLICPHARRDVFEPLNNRNRIDYHRLFIVPHSSPKDGGRVIDEAGRRALPLKPRTVLLLPARRLYRFEFARGLRLIGFHFRLEAAPGHDVLGASVQMKSGSLSRQESEDAWRALKLEQPDDWLRSEALLRWHLGSLVSFSWQDVSAQIQVARSWKNVLTQLAHAPAGGANVSRLAVRDGCSREHFSRRFRAQFGVNPRTWHRQQLAARAIEQLLLSNEPLSVIAEEFGFSDQFAFSKFIRQAIGLSPTALRRNGPWQPAAKSIS